MDNLDILFGRNVRSARQERDISQERLALLSGIDRSYMSRIERGIVSITLRKAYMIAAALDCELNELLPERKSLRKKKS